MHTETTLEDLEHCVTRLGDSLRRFKGTTCEHFHTSDLPSEEAARGRRQAALSAQGKGPVTRKAPATKKRVFNLETYKMHSLGDYTSSIRMFGTIDNTSTQLVTFTSDTI
ncbi:MAG TPA: hypothetical protein VGO47_05190 [Chlamydiales bacterium]|nr:hypothetical protein [Chlamydiales bacterium]